MMKKLFSKFTAAMIALFAIMLTLPQSAQAQQAYAVLDAGTLTFYYDGQKATRTGTVYDMPAEGNDPAWAGSFLYPNKTVKQRSEEHTSELQSRQYLVCRL